MNSIVTAVALSPVHGFSKALAERITLIAGLGVEGDTHLGTTVQHRSRVAADPTQPNLRQVHLLHAELFAELRPQGFAIGPGDIGENVTTQGVDLLALAVGTRLHLGRTAIVSVTGLRNPCRQLDTFRPGLMRATLDRDAAGGLVLRAGVMAIVVVGGEVRPGDGITVEWPSEPHEKLRRV